MKKTPQIYIPQNVDPYNTHLKNLIDAYIDKNVKVVSGYNHFLSANFVPDVIHFHHIEGLLAFLDYNLELFWNRLLFFKQKGVIFMHTLHNIEPHSQNDFFDYRNFFTKYTNFIEVFIHHGELSIEILKKKYPNAQSKQHVVCHHGDYLNDMKSFSKKPMDARRILSLPLDKKIILVFGQLQYKSPKFVQSVFDLLYISRKDLYLVMAGVNPRFRYNKVNKLYYLIVNNVLNLFNKNKKIINKRFSQYETYLLFTAADLIFLPHQKGLTTGLIPMAATLKKPFVYPNIGVFNEQAQHCNAIEYNAGDVESAKKSILELLNYDKLEYDNSEWLKRNNWDDYANRLLNKLQLDSK